MLRVVAAFNLAGSSQPPYCKDKGFVNSTKRPEVGTQYSDEKYFRPCSEGGVSSHIRVVDGQSHVVDFQQNISSLHSGLQR